MRDSCVSNRVPRHSTASCRGANSKSLFTSLEETELTLRVIIPHSVADLAFSFCQLTQFTVQGASFVDHRQPIYLLIWGFFKYQNPVLVSAQPLIWRRQIEPPYIVVMEIHLFCRELDARN